MAYSADYRGIDLIIPFYRNAGLVTPLFRSLQEVRDELSDLSCTVVAINDSPDDAELDPVLSAAVDSLSTAVPSRLIRNERNMGFVRSVNAAARQSIAARHDVLLLNSDTIVFPGALREIRKVAACDPFIGFVSPRSNNATVCSFPPQQEFRDIEPDESYAIFRQLCGYLPQYHLVPTAVGFCLLIKLEVLEEFGIFDESYGHGYNEENELIMRANRCGYRAALANHAFVYHVGESSFFDQRITQADSGRKERSAAEKAISGVRASITKYFEGVYCQAERLVAGMLPDPGGRLDLVFDFSSVGLYHNGTFEACKEILFRATKTWREFNLYVMASDEAIRFHRLDELERVFFVSPSTQRKFAMAFRFGQPFDYEQLFRMSRIAPLNVYGMLDPIAYDCLYLDNVNLDTIWDAVFTHSDGIIYISDFVEEQFRRRFRRREGLQELVAYLSLDYRDYTDEEPASTPDGSYILVIGNAFAHKRVPTTVDALSQAFPREKIVVLGLAEDHRQNVISYPSGHLSEKQMDRIMRGARFVVFPSVYEGFGIPVVKSLAYGKPILARSIPTTCAIKKKLNDDENLILYSSTEELVQRLRQGFPEWKNGTGGHGDPCGGWDAITEQIGQFLVKVSRSFSLNDVLVPRLQHVRLLEEKKPRHGSGAQSEEAADPKGLTAALRDREAQIEDLHNSLSWRITAPMRRLADVYLRLKGQS